MSDIPCTCGGGDVHSADCLIFWSPFPFKPREMVLGDLYAYRQFGWHQFGWPILPPDWYV